MKIRAISYNIHKGFDTSGIRFTLHKIKTAIQESNADIVLLQEVVGENQKLAQKLESWPIQAQFEYLADSLWPHYSYGKNAIFSYRHHGNAVLSRFPLVFEENLDISTNRFESRGLLHCVLDIPTWAGRHLHIFNTHLNLLEGGRKVQIQKIIQRIEEKVPKEAPFLFGGDFNDWSEKVTPSLMQNLGVIEAFYSKNGTHAVSFPSAFPFMKLDRFYCKNLNIQVTQVLQEDPWPELSDHLPLFIEFELP